MIAPVMALLSATLAICLTPRAWNQELSSQTSGVAGAVVPGTIPCNDQQAANGEAYLRDHPQDVGMAACLLDYYAQRLDWPELQPARLRLLQWVIDNHPAIRLSTHLANGLQVSTADPLAYSQVRNLWFRQAKRFPNNAEVLANAANSLALTDRETAETWFKRAEQLEPADETIVPRLAALYAAAIIGVSETGSDLMPLHLDAAEAHSAFARHAYEAASRDATLATWTALELHHWTTFLRARNMTRADHDALAETLLLRAAELSYPNPTRIDALRDFYRDQTLKSSGAITSKAATVERSPDEVARMLTESSREALEAYVNQAGRLRVTVAILIGTDGHVWTSHPENPSSGASALAAAQQAESLSFHPLHVNGKAVQIRSTITIAVNDLTPRSQ